MASDSPHLTAHERVAAMVPSRQGPLTGVRIVDFTHALAGPFCTMILGDLGADVVKIEPPSGDFTRHQGPYTRDDSARVMGGYFASVNRSKRSIVLDLRDADDLEVALRLVDDADVVVENFRVGVAERLGLGYDTLAARKPGLVYAAIRGFGDPRTGESPFADWPAYDVVAQAMGGIVSWTGTAEGDVLKVGPSVGDLYPATFLAVGILAGLVHARETGQGQFVDVGMVDALIALDEAIVYRYSYTGQVARPGGNMHPVLSPFDIFSTTDGSCAIAAPTQQFWTALCPLIGRPDLLTDERSDTPDHRSKNRAWVRDQILAWTSVRSNAEVMAVLGGHLPAGPVNDAAAIFADPHVRARDMLVAVDQAADGARPVVFPNTPLRFSATPGGIHRRAPILGEHTEEIRQELSVRRNAGR
jgi:crotonobetainyl-CoA:carnitine CoA-transferase CaiB-like acyl-CoA transferase